MDQMHNERLQSLHAGDELFVNDNQEVILRGENGRADHILGPVDSEELPNRIAQLRQTHADFGTEAATLQQDWDSNVDRAGMAPRIAHLQQQLREQPYLGDARELHADLENKMQTINDEYAPALTVNEQAAEVLFDAVEGTTDNTNADIQNELPADTPEVPFEYNTNAQASNISETSDTLKERANEQAGMPILETNFSPKNEEEDVAVNDPTFEDTVVKDIDEDKIDIQSVTSSDASVGEERSADSAEMEVTEEGNSLENAADITPAQEQEVQRMEATELSEQKPAAMDAEEVVDSPESESSTETEKTEIVEDKSVIPEKTSEERHAEAEELAKDQMLNLDKKLELCEKAEAIQESEDWRKTTDEQNKLMDEWKTIGEVTSFEKNDEVWNRFAAARKKFFDRKQVHAEEIEVEQAANLLKKQALLKESKELQHSTEWGTATKRMISLQEEWEAIGRVPRKVNDAIWREWKATRDVFFQAKKGHFASFKNELDDNFAKKIALTDRAEELQNSSDWHGTTDELSHLMEQWKSVGPVPRAKSNELWDRFNAARRAFFKNKDEDRDKRKAHFLLKSEGRIGQAKINMQDMEVELKDDEERLAEFKETLAAPMGDGKKDQELRDHLMSLVAKLEESIPRKRQKMVNAKADVQQMEKGGKKKED